MTLRLPPADSKTLLGGRRRGKQGFAQRLASAKAFLGYTDEDGALIRATGDVVLAQSDAIVEAFYDYLLSHRETAVHFARPDGQTDREAVARRHAPLKEWLLLAVEAPLDDQLSGYLAEVGRAHTGRGSGASGRVNARYLVWSMTFLQLEVARVLADAIPDSATLLAANAAWTKLLMVHLDLFLAVYASGEGTAHWY